jgi:UDP-N-acetylmuramoyl-tripeptide--D-alanyl-D-alanine ligase
LITFAPARVAAEAGARVVREGAVGHFERAITDSRQARAGDLFFGLAGEHADGGEFAGDALASGAWGAVVREGVSVPPGDGWVFESAQPLRALHDLARAWRRELGCKVVGITGSTGKTSVKDICRAILPGRVHASPQNYNTEIGLPLTILAAPEETETLVLEMAMRGRGQIEELCAIAEPDVGVITNIGPVHLELLGTMEAIAEAKAEIIAGLGEGHRAVLPAEEEALEPHLHDRMVTLTFGPGGDVFALETDVDDGVTHALIGTPDGEQRFDFPFPEAHNLLNAMCAIAIGVALDAPLPALAANAPRIEFSRLRGERIVLADGAVLINDSYNANPLSMRAALDNLRATATEGRRVAVLGDMFELGPQADEFHREVGAHARALGIDVILGVGALAREYAPDEWAPSPAAAAALAERVIGAGDTVLVKGSRGVELERFTDELAARRGRAPA